MRTNFILVQQHKYSLTDIENLMPWEREVYLTLLTQHIDELKEQMQAQQQNG